MKIANQTKQLVEILEDINCDKESYRDGCKARCQQDDKVKAGKDFEKNKLEQGF